MVAFSRLARAGPQSAAELRRLLERKARGVTLTAAGQVFLDQARLALLQVEAADEAARRAEQP